MVKLDIVPVALPILREIPESRLKFLEMPGGTEVGEFVDYIKGVVADLDYGDLAYILGTHIGLLEADCEAKVFTCAGEFVDEPLHCCLGSVLPRQHRQRRACQAQEQF